MSDDIPDVIYYGFDTHPEVRSYVLSEDYDHALENCTKYIRADLVPPQD